MKKLITIKNIWCAYKQVQNQGEITGLQCSAWYLFNKHFMDTYYLQYNMLRASDFLLEKRSGFNFQTNFIKIIGKPGFQGIQKENAKCQKLLNNQSALLF